MSIVCQVCDGESTIEVCDSPTGSGPETHRKKCPSCDSLGRLACACGMPATLWLRGGGYCARCLPRAPEINPKSAVFFILARLP
jgi:hypothetical protein